MGKKYWLALCVVAGVAGFCVAQPSDAGPQIVDDALAARISGGTCFDSTSVMGCVLQDTFIVRYNWCCSTCGMTLLAMRVYDDGDNEPLVEEPCGVLLTCFWPKEVIDCDNNWGI